MVYYVIIIGQHDQELMVQTIGTGDTPRIPMSTSTPLSIHYHHQLMRDKMTGLNEKIEKNV